MKAITADRYGSPDALELVEAETPAVEPDRVLLRVRAASVNAGDWRTLRGRPLVARPMMGGVLRPKDTRRGTDVAGVVEAVGADVADLAAGDEVFGTCRGAFAEYATPLARSLVRKPAGLSFEEAAAVPVAAITALQAVRDHGRLQPGQRVLVNGAGGGVGTFTVQIARVLGGHVTAVCHTHNVDLVRSLGAERVVDYTREDFTKTGERYDLVVDNAGGRSPLTLRSLLAPSGTLVVVGAARNPITHLLATVALNPFVRQTLRGFIAKLKREDLQFVADLVEAGEIRPIVDRTYTLQETRDAVRYLEGGHARGKVVITV
ncbi:MAG TPA: NAD(P)-dependent alcohol dehydrogenase [Gaiellaceae bacterium]|nr:NAD(P)-dependent alcohol dehydrogenase [Gaiellaceae bacterium]